MAHSSPLLPMSGEAPLLLAKTKLRPHHHSEDPHDGTACWWCGFGSCSPRRISGRLLPLVALPFVFIILVMVTTENTNTSTNIGISTYSVEIDGNAREPDNGKVVVEVVEKEEIDARKETHPSSLSSPNFFIAASSSSSIIHHHTTSPSSEYDNNATGDKNPSTNNASPAAAQQHQQQDNHNMQATPRTQPTTTIIINNQMKQSKHPQLLGTALSYKNRNHNDASAAAGSSATTLPKRPRRSRSNRNRSGGESAAFAGRADYAVPDPDGNANSASSSRRSHRGASAAIVGAGMSEEQRNALKQQMDAHQREQRLKLLRRAEIIANNSKPVDVDAYEGKVLRYWRSDRERPSARSRLFLSLESVASSSSTDTNNVNNNNPNLSSEDGDVIKAGSTSSAAVPVGEPHSFDGPSLFPYFGEDEHIDEASRIMYSITTGPTFPRTAHSFSSSSSSSSSSSDSTNLQEEKYDHPEHADSLAKPGSIWHEMITHYRNANMTVLLDPLSPLLCYLSAVYTGNCLYLDESFAECAVRMGGKGRLERALSSKCRGSRWWAELRVNQAINSDSDSTTAGGSSDENNNRIALPPKLQASSPLPELRMGLVYEAEVCQPHKKQSSSSSHYYIPPSNRTPTPYGPPRHCRNGALQYPLHLSTPAINVDRRLLPKLWDIMPLPIGPRLGGADQQQQQKQKQQYLFDHNDEDTMRALYGMSYFAMSHGRGGWDCSRNLEMMSAGCVPMLYDVHATGPYIFPHYPKHFLRTVVKLPIFSHLGYIQGADGEHFFGRPSSSSASSSSSAPPNEHIRFSSFEGRDKVEFLNEPYRFSTTETTSTTKRKKNAPNAGGGETAAPATADAGGRSSGVGLNKTWYWQSARQMTEYVRRYMTTESSAASMLRTMDHTSAKNVLVLTRNNWDNLQLSIISGLDGLGIAQTVVHGPLDRPLYNCVGETSDGLDLLVTKSSKKKDSSSPSPLEGNPLLSNSDLATIRDQNKRWRAYGGGAPLANRLRSQKTIFRDNGDPTILEQLQKGEFDTVFITFYSHPEDFDFEMIRSLKRYVGNKIAVIDGSDTRDDPRLNSIAVAREAFFFSRELRRVWC